INKIKRNNKKCYITVATTGIAAIQANAETVHSLFGIQIGFQDYNLNRYFRLSDEKKNIIRRCNTIIVDESSMLRCDLLDAMDKRLKQVCRNNKLFGGKQVVLCGDLSQLPAIITKDEKELFIRNYGDSCKGYFFEAKCLKENYFPVVNLKHIYRQTDQVYIDILERLRNDTITQNDIDLLNSRVVKDIPNDAIVLTPTNLGAEFINDNKFNDLQSKQYIYHGIIRGDIKTNDIPISNPLKLKEGCRIMFVRNDNNEIKRFVNGSLGYVSFLGNNEIHVNVDNRESVVNVERFEWEKMRYIINEKNELKLNIIGTYTNFPLKLEKITLGPVASEQQTLVAELRALAYEKKFSKLKKKCEDNINTSKINIYR
ncbi:MAG: AAA family ATPase, partial [Bacilli bacterium]|nr:AAA family ATPase [Bacilli bacterium]